MNDSLHVVCPQCSSTNRLSAGKLSDRPKCGKCKHPLFNKRPLVLKGSTINKHITRNDIPVVIDFWAPWCGPCKVMIPVFEMAATRLEPSVRFAKVNTEVEQLIASQFKVQSIPTIIIFKKGNEIARHSGTMDLNSLIDWVKSNIQSI